MPWAAAPTGAAPTFLEALLPLYHVDWGGAGRDVAELATLPGQVVVSLLLVAVGAELLRRRHRFEAAAGWLAAWGLGTAVEVLCKQAIVRPALFRDGAHVAGFDSSWPSGHTLRSALVAAALAAALPRGRAALAVWFVSVPVLLVAAGLHTPSDVVGGLLLAGLLALGVRALERSGLLRRRAALRAGRAGPATARRRARRAAPR